MSYVMIEQPIKQASALDVLNRDIFNLVYDYMKSEEQLELLLSSDVSLIKKILELICNSLALSIKESVSFVFFL